MMWLCFYNCIYWSLMLSWQWIPSVHWEHLTVFSVTSQRLVDNDSCHCQFYRPVSLLFVDFMSALSSGSYSDLLSPSQSLFSHPECLVEQSVYHTCPAVWLVRYRLPSKRRQPLTIYCRNMGTAYDIAYTVVANLLINAPNFPAFDMSPTPPIPLPTHLTMKETDQ